MSKLIFISAVLAAARPSRSARRALPADEPNGGQCPPYAKHFPGHDA